MDSMQAIAKISTTWPSIGAALEESDMKPTESAMLNSLIHRVISETVALDRAVDSLTTAYANGWSTVDAAETVVRAQSWLNASTQMMSTVDGGLLNSTPIDVIESNIREVVDSLMMHPESPRSTSPVFNYSALEMNDAVRDIARLIRRS